MNENNGSETTNFINTDESSLDREGNYYPYDLDARNSRVSQFKKEDENNLTSWLSIPSSKYKKIFDDSVSDCNDFKILSDFDHNVHKNREVISNNGSDSRKSIPSSLERNHTVTEFNDRVSKKKAQFSTSFP